MATFLKESYFDGKNGSHFKQSLYYDIEQDIANNKSYITYYGYVGSVDGYSGSGSTACVYINGSEVGSFSSLSSYSSDTLRGTLSRVEVKHNSDGTGSASYSMTTDTSWTLGDSSLSGSFTLPTIPRASTASASNTNIESTVRINTNRASGSFTHTIKVSFGSFSRQWTGVGTYVDWDTNDNKDSLYGQIPNSPSGTCTITCTTYNGSTNLGTKTSTFKLIASESITKPTVKVDAVDTNKTLPTGNTIQDITKDTTNKTIIKYISDVAVSLTATANNSASISSTKITSGSGTYYNNTEDFTATFTNVETDSFAGQAIDSRTYTGTDDVNDLTMLDYLQLSISPVNLYKTNQTSNDLYAEINGNYFNDKFGEIDNVITLSFKYKESGSDWTGNETWITLTPTVIDNTYKFDGLLGNSFDYTKIYDFVFKVEDLVSVKAYETSSIPGIPIIGIFENFVEMWGEVFVYKN